MLGLKNDHMRNNLIWNGETQRYSLGTQKKKRKKIGIWYTIETCWCDGPHTLFILPIQYSMERTLLIWCWLVFRHLQIHFFQTWYDDRDPYVLDYNISLDDLDLHSRSQLDRKSKPLVSIFSQIYLLIRLKFGMLPQPVGLLKLMLTIICTSNIQGRELCWRDSMKFMLSIVTCQNICEAIRFKLSMMLSTTKL